MPPPTYDEREAISVSNVVLKEEQSLRRYCVSLSAAPSALDETPFLTGSQRDGAAIQISYEFIIDIRKSLIVSNFDALGSAQNCVAPSAKQSIRD